MEKVFVLDSVSGEPVFTQFRHNAKGAIEALMEAGGGVAIAALYHPDVGDIDLRWGHTSDDDRAKGMGLAKLIRWHPEVMNDLQGFISSLKARPQKHKRKNEIHLSDGMDRRAGIKMIWNGETSHWLVTAYIKPSESKKNVSASKGIPASLDDALEPTTATSSNADAAILGFECPEVNPVLDDASVPDVAAMMARAKLTKELRSLKVQILALGKDPVSMIKSARLVEQLRKIRKELGVGIKTAENPHVATLKAVAAGQHDTKGVPALFGLIQEAVNGLDEAGLLAGDAENAANDACTHWGELEERLSANV